MDVHALIESLPDRLSLLTTERTGSGASPERVSEAERTLGVRFPNTFVAFLRRYGWADFEYFAVYGLGKDTPAHLDLIKAACVARSPAGGGVPPHLIPVMTDGAGNNYCLDCDLLKDDECPVVLWQRDGPADQIPLVVGEDYLMWLGDELDELLVED